MKEPSRLTTILLSVVASLMLLFAVYGEPIDSYFRFMKLIVLGATMYAALAVYRRSEKLVPLSLGLVALGALEFLESMPREEWVIWNWATVTAFLIVIGVFLKNPKEAASIAVGTNPEKVPATPADDTSPKGTKDAEVGESTASIRDQEGRTMASCSIMPNEGPLMTLVKGVGTPGFLARSALFFANTISESDKVIISRWAGLTRNAWTDEHREAFATAFMHCLKNNGKVGDVAPEALRIIKRDLSKDTMPVLSAPLTPEVVDLVDRLFEAH